MKRPIKKDYCKPFSLDDKLITFDSKQYAKDAEAYIEHLTGIMRLTSGNLRDVAVCLGQAHKDFSTVHQLADRLYNATITK